VTETDNRLLVHLQMLDSFKALEDVIKTECGNGPVYYLPNYGNWGDGLIRHGTLKFFSDINLEFREMTTINKDWILPVLRGGTAIYGGGGSWCKYWDRGQFYTQRLQKRFNVIVLPSTYESNYSIRKTTFFRRDEYESKIRMPDSFFCHDMAFYIARDFVNRKGEGNGAGYFFRTDGESALGGQLPASNRDLSLEGHQRSDTAQFFSVINSFSIIHTDRLHVSIAACLLGKETHIYAGSYFKNQAVYLSSMKNHFENVHFHENIDG
jgi:exopolysaccharide biosynthesis predicted pyruvyltransferase EpsI